MKFCQWLVPACAALAVAGFGRVPGSIGSEIAAEVEEQVGPGAKRTEVASYKDDADVSSGGLGDFSAAKEILQDLIKTGAAVVAAAGEGGDDSKKSLGDVLTGPSGALLKIAGEQLGIDVTKLQTSAVVPMLKNLQKNVHEHYMLTKGGPDAHKTSNLLNRVMTKKTKSKVIKSLKQIAPGYEDEELVEQLDVVMQLLHEMQQNPASSPQAIMSKVASMMGVTLDEETLKHVEKHMSWAQKLITTIMPHLGIDMGALKSSEDEL